MKVLGLLLILFICLSYAVLCLWKEADLVKGASAGVLFSLLLYSMVAVVMVWFHVFAVNSAMYICVIIAAIIDAVFLFKKKRVRIYGNWKQNSLAILAGAVVFLICFFTVNQNYYGIDTWIGIYQTKTMIKLNNYESTLNLHITKTSITIYPDDDYKQYDETMTEMRDKVEQAKNVIVVSMVLSASMFGQSGMLYVAEFALAMLTILLVSVLSSLFRQRLLAIAVSIVWVGFVSAILIMIFNKLTPVCSWNELDSIRHTVVDGSSKSIVVDENITDDVGLAMGSMLQCYILPQTGTIKNDISRVYDIESRSSNYGEKIYYMTETPLTESEIHSFDGTINLVYEGQYLIYQMDSSYVNKQTTEKSEYFTENMMFMLLVVIGVLLLACGIEFLRRESKFAQSIMIAWGIYVLLYVIYSWMFIDRAETIKDSLVLCALISLIFAAVSMMAGTIRPLGYSGRDVVPEFILILAVCCVVELIKWPELTASAAISSLQQDAIYMMYPNVGNMQYTIEMPTSLWTGVLALCGRVFGSDHMYRAIVVLFSAGIGCVAGVIQLVSGRGWFTGFTTWRDTAITNLQGQNEAPIANQMAVGEETHDTSHDTSHVASSAKSFAKSITDGTLYKQMRTKVVTVLRNVFTKQNMIRVVTCRISVTISAVILFVVLCVTYLWSGQLIYHKSNDSWDDLDTVTHVVKDADAIVINGVTQNNIDTYISVLTGAAVYLDQDEEQMETLAQRQGNRVYLLTNEPQSDTSMYHLVGNNKIGYLYEYITEREDDES